VTLPPPEPASPKGETIPLNIVYEDDSIIVIDKPKGLVVHPAAGHATGTLVNALIAHCGASLSGIGGVKRPGIVHRLDKDTTGLMVVAKSDKAHRALSKQFAEKADGPLKRGYLALVWGAPDRPKGTVDAPVGRHAHARDKQAVRRDGRAAVTHWEVLERFAGADGKPMASLPPAPSKRGVPTRSACTWRISGTPFLGTRPTGPASGPKPVASAQRLGRPWRPLADRLCMPIYWQSNTPKPAISWSSNRNCRAICVVYVRPCTRKAVKPGYQNENRPAKSVVWRPP
jgi:23S rRNA pseudouridine1911/1915/1917 synthase